MTMLMTTLAATLGGVALSAATTGYHYLFFRDVLGDGQYAFVYLATVPMGAALGAASWHIGRHGADRPALRFWLWLMANAVVFGLIAAWAANAGTAAAPFWMNFLMVSVFLLPAVLWAVLLTWWVIRQCCR